MKKLCTLMLMFSGAALAYDEDDSIAQARRSELAKKPAKTVALQDLGLEQDCSDFYNELAHLAQADVPQHDEVTIE